ncbi:Casein kinase II subunit alpha [Nymphaea thermarum]|nr:Casein kinase II subunit alpha [Nymphaea thermarum]
MDTASGALTVPGTVNTAPSAYPSPYLYPSGTGRAIDFLDKLLRYDHLERVTAREAMGATSR